MAETVHGQDGAALTFHQLLDTMRAKLDRRGFSQVPQLSSTNAIPLDREFRFYGPVTDEAEPAYESEAY